MKLLLTVFVAVYLLIMSAVCKAELKVEADKENVVASGLEGTWRKDSALTARLTGGKAYEESEEPVLTFKSDSGVAGKLTEKYGTIIKDKKIFMAGITTFHDEKDKDKELPFILIEHHGNPQIVWFREREGYADRGGDLVSYNVMLIVAKDRDKDMLFIDYPLFPAFSRVIPKAGK